MTPAPIAAPCAARENPPQTREEEMKGHNLCSVSSGPVQEMPAGLGGLVLPKSTPGRQAGCSSSSRWIIASAMCKTESFPEEIPTATWPGVWPGAGYANAARRCS